MVILKNKFGEKNIKYQTIFLDTVTACCPDRSIQNGRDLSHRGESSQLNNEAKSSPPNNEAKILRPSLSEK